MSDDLVFFTTPEEFNKTVDYICPNAFDECNKFIEFFTKNYESNGPDTFLPTMAVFSHLKNFIGLVTCRPADDKHDLFSAIAEMLFFPMSISSELFIIASDVNIESILEDFEAKDALVISFVSPDNCLIYTIPYSYDDNNQLVWHHSKSFINKVATGGEKDQSPVGEMVELFFVYSHGNSTGPFQYDEVLAYFDANNFIYEIFHPQNIRDNHIIAIPFAN